jgi:hypothetical protein
MNKRRNALMTNVYVGTGKCNVAYCKETGEFENTDSHMLYCNDHAKMIDYKIIFSANNVNQLVKIKNKGKTISIRNLEDELKKLKSRI